MIYIYNDQKCILICDINGLFIINKHIFIVNAAIIQFINHCSDRDCHFVHNDVCLSSRP